MTCTIRCLSVVVLIPLIIGPGVPTAGGQVVTNISVPTGGVVIVPCANGGAGEVVAFSGVLHCVFAVTSDSTGRSHVKSSVNGQGLSGVGLTSGNLYQVVGVEQSQFTLDGSASSTSTSVLTFNVIGQGPGNNLLTQITLHFTTNAKGDATASVSFDRVDCR